MNKHKNQSLSRRLRLLFTITILIAIGTSLGFQWITSQSIKKEKRHYVENTLDNLTQNLADISSSVILMSETVSNTSYTKSFLTKSSESEKIYYRQLLNRLINRLIKSSSHISNILLLDNEGSVFSFSSFNYLQASRLDRKYHILTMDSLEEGFTGAMYLSDDQNVYYAYIQTIYDDNSSLSGQSIGACVIICSCASLQSLCENTATIPQSVFAILDSEGQILSSNQDSETTSLAMEASSKRNLSLYRQAQGEIGWSLFCSVPYRELYAELANIRFLSVILISMILLSFCILVAQTQKNVIAPLTGIVTFLQKDPWYIMHNPLQITGDQEILILSETINQMLNQINELTHKVLANQSRLYEIKLHQEQAQLLALRSQVNPHFLFNSLNSIQGLALQGKSLEVCNAVGSLSEMMRYNLTGGTMSSVNDEFCNVEKYLAIIRLRFPARFSVSLSIEESAARCQLPRFILQPLVENAIEHGLIPLRERKGTLSLSAFLRPDNILCVVCTDNGVGMEPTRLAAIRRKLKETSELSVRKRDGEFGIGLSNIHMQIRLIYGDPYGLTIQSSPEGTTVTISFPARPAKND